MLHSCFHRSLSGFGFGSDSVLVFCQMLCALATLAGIHWPHCCHCWPHCLIIISCGFAQKSREQAALAAKVMFHTAWPLVLGVAVLHPTLFCPPPCSRSLLCLLTLLPSVPSYLSEEDVLDQSNPFVQLVSGVVWLLRNGEVYINQSRAAECGDTQTTGKYCGPSACPWVFLPLGLLGEGALQKYSFHRLME